MGRLYLKYTDDNEFYVCKDCGTHLTTVKDLVSKVSNTILLNVL